MALEGGFLHNGFVMKLLPSKFGTIVCMQEVRATALLQRALQETGLLTLRSSIVENNSVFQDGEMIKQGYFQKIFIFDKNTTNKLF